MGEGELSSGVTLAVLGSAALHATWNSLIRGAGDKGLFTLLLSAWNIGFSLLGLVFVGFPAVASLPFLLASGLLHTIYIIWLMKAYDGGQLALSYTLMRGLPPLFVAMVAGPLLGESLGLSEWLGVACISGGVLAVGMASGRSLRHVLGHPSSRSAMLNATAIAAYTIVDGTGARLSENVLGYALCLFCIEPLLVLIFHYRKRAAAMRDYFVSNWRLGAVGSLCSMIAYCTVLWAMTQAPVALVASLRESSVIFAVLIGSLWFREGHLRIGLIAGLMVIAGVFLLRQ